MTKSHFEWYFYFWLNVFLSAFIYNSQCTIISLKIAWLFYEKQENEFPYILIIQLTPVSSKSFVFSTRTHLLQLTLPLEYLNYHFKQRTF